jgi:Ca2+-binding EF-hand superfamily protein
MKSAQLLIPALVAAALILPACTTVGPTHDRFAEADTNHDGQLTRREVAAYLAGQMVDARDKDNDGTLTMEEWNPTKNAKDTKAFREADVNHDGVVTLGEATNYAEKSGIVNRFMKEADTNKDGKISRAEALAYYGSKEGPAR